MYCTTAAIITLFLSVLSVQAMGDRKKVTRPKNIVNVQAVQDSAVLMADDYATSLVEKPEMAEFRLNLFKAFYNRQPQIAQDSVRSKIYMMMANYIDGNRMDRGKAFKNCYMAIAHQEDERMGNIYAAEITLAYEEDDTVEIKRVLPLLEDFVRKTNYDFTTEISEAEDYLHYMRTRRPINEELMGVWVSENFVKERPYRENVLKELFALDMVNGMTHEKNYHNLSHPYFLSITNDKILTCIVSCYKDLSKVGYCVPQDIIAAGKYKQQKSYLFDRLSPYGGLGLYKDDYYNTYPQVMQYDENLRSAYALWSNEIINSFTPDYYAQLRQNMQYRSAEVIGNTARKNVKMSTKIRAQAAVTAMDAISNSIIDRLTVSSAVFWVREMTLQQNSPNTLTVWAYTQYNRTRSNTGQTMTWDKDYDGVKYYKWEPEDSVFFRAHYNDFVTIPTKISKPEKKRMKQYYKEQMKLYQKEFGKLGRSRDKWDDFIMWFNNKMFNKLKAKAERQE